jgi:hypothetical protein
MGRVVDRRISLREGSRGKPPVCKRRKAAILGAVRRVRRIPPGSESGAGIQRGNAGTWESPLSPCPHSRMRGPGDHRPWRGRGLPPDHAPARDTTPARKQARYRAASDERSDPRGGEWQSSRRIVPTKVGNQGPRDPREGRRRRASRGVGRTDGRDVAITNRHTKTPTHCRTGRPRA